tara:strand:- start:612 stop:782 length:171 start_codon:yes stop_codon:yes gene_type:complete
MVDCEIGNTKRKKVNNRQGTIIIKTNIGYLHHMYPGIRGPRKKRETQRKSLTADTS